jgi:hypothetical protein
MSGPSEEEAAPKTVSRKNAKWESTVFAGPTENIPGRKCLAKEGAGKQGLWGDQKEEW